MPRLLSSQIQPATIPQGSYLVSPAAEDGTSKAVLIEGSLSLNQNINSRVALCTWDTNVTAGVHAAFDGVNDKLGGVRLRIFDSNGIAVTGGTTTLIPFGRRYHFLASAWVDGVNLYGVVYIWNPLTRAWVEAANTSNTTIADTTLDLGTAPQVIFRRQDSGSHFFEGGLYRFRMWRSTTGAAIADITNSAVRDNFTKGLATRPAATANALYGSPWVYFENDPDALEIGDNYGTGGQYSKFGPAIGDVYVDPDPEDPPPEETDPPVISGKPTIDGTGETDTALTANAAAVTGDGTITTAFSWLIGGTVVQTGTTYTPGAGQAGNSVILRQTSTNEYGETTSDSDPLPIYAPASAPVISGTPSLSGSPQVGQTLFATPASSSGTGPITTTWQWYTVSGGAISGATSSSFALTNTELGENVYVRQTDTNGQGADTADSAAVLVVEAGAGLSVTVDVTPPRGPNIAPATWLFKANVVEDIQRAPTTGQYASYTDLTYMLMETEWTWSDIETGTYQVPERQPVPGNFTRNKGSGPEAMHCYTDPGTHNGSVTVTFPDGRTGTATFQIVVQDPEDTAVVPSSVKMVVSPTSNFTGAPANAGQYTTLRAAWETGLAGLSGVDYAEILLSPGETHSFSGNSLDMDVITPKQVRVASWDRGGTKANISVPDNNTGKIFKGNREGLDISLRWEDLSVEAVYDSSLEQGLILGTFYGGENTEEAIVNNCEFRGVGSVFTTGNDSGNPKTDGTVSHLNSCLFVDIVDFAMIWPRHHGYNGFTGNTYKTSPQPASGGRGKVYKTNESANVRNRHNGLRVAGDLLYVAHNDIFACWSWSGFTGMSLNPPGRFGRNNPPNMRTIATGNTITGSFNAQLDNAVGLINPRYFIYERNFCIVSPLDGSATGNFSGLFVGRNNIITMHNTPQQAGGNKWRSPFSVGPYRENTETFNEPCFVYNNTLLDYTTNENNSGDRMFCRNGSNEMNHIEEANNVQHRPNVSPAVLADVDIATKLPFSSRQEAARLNWISVEDITIASTVNPGGSLTIPYSETFTFRENIPVGQDQFSDINNDAISNEMKMSYFVSAGVSVQLDTPSVGQVTITNNTGFDWPDEVLLQLRFAPIGTSDPKIKFSASSFISGAGGTVVINNPNGYTPNGGYHVSVSGRALTDFSIAATVSGIEVTNVSTGHWPAGAEWSIRIDTNNNQPPPMTSYAHPANTLSLCRPNAAIAAGSDDQLKALVDFTGAPRVGGNHPLSPGGTFTSGAIDP